MNALAERALALAQGAEHRDDMTVICVKLRENVDYDYNYIKNIAFG